MNPKNLVEAAKWYYKSAEQGFNAAQFMIGHCLMTGEGVPQNRVEGVKAQNQYGRPFAELKLL